MGNCAVRTERLLWEETMVTLYFRVLHRDFFVNSPFSAVYLRLMNQGSIFVSNSTMTRLGESVCWQWNVSSKSKSTLGRLDQGSEPISIPHFLKALQVPQNSRQSMCAHAVPTPHFRSSQYLPLLLLQGPSSSCPSVKWASRLDYTKMTIINSPLALFLLVQRIG